MTGRKWREIIGSLQSMFTTLLIMPEGWNKLKVRKGREGKERKGKERKGKERKGKGREGKGREGKANQNDNSKSQYYYSSRQRQ